MAVAFQEIYDGNTIETILDPNTREYKSMTFLDKKTNKLKKRKRISRRKV